MKYILLLTVLLSLVLLSAYSYSQEIIQGPFLIRDGITYRQNTNKPVTGVVGKYWNNGQLQYRSNWQDGKRHGLDESFYEYGQLSARANYKDGERDGLFEHFNEGGQLKGKTCYKNGEKTDMSYCEK